MKKISRLTALLLALLLIFQMTAVATEGSSEDNYVVPTPIPQENLDADILMQLSNDAAEVAAAIDTVRGMGVTANQDLIPLRKYPNFIWGDKIAELSAGTFVMVYDTMGSGIISGEWYKVCYNGQDGYIHSSLLNVCSCNVQEGAGLDAHADGCPDKMYYVSICALTAEEIAENWAEYTEEGKAFILLFLSRRNQAKLAVLQGMLGDKPSKKVVVEGVAVQLFGNIPEDVEVAVESKEAYVNDVSAQLSSYAEVKFVYSISLINEDGSKWQPAEGETIKVSVDAIGLTEGSRFGILHESDDGTFEKLGVSVVTDGKLEFVTNSFSTFYGYTVDFVYNGVSFSMPGESSVSMTEVLAQLGITDWISSDVTNVTFSNPELIHVYQDELTGEWMLQSLQSFNTAETLVLTFSSGETLSINVYDAVTLTSATWSGTNTDNTEYTVSGNVTLTLANNANISRGAQITINSNATLTVQGAGTLVRSGYQKQLFNVMSGGTLIINGTDGKIVIDGGDNVVGTEAAIHSDGGTVKLYNVTVKNCHHIDDMTGQTNTRGGGIYILANGNENELLIDECLFTNNTAREFGGGVYSSCKTTIKNSEFSYNFAVSTGMYSPSGKGHGGAITITGENAVCTMEEVDIHDNQAMYYGGAIQVMSNANLELKSGKIHNNKAILHGAGAIHVTASAVFKMSGGKITNNEARNYGGAIHTSYSCKLYLNAGEISNNICHGRGGGIHVDCAGDLELNGTDFYGNQALDSFLYESATVTGNHEVEVSGTMYLADTNVGAHGYGGAVLIDSGTCTMNGGTISGNFAGNGGGAIALVMIIVGDKNGANEDNRVAEFTMNGGEFLENKTNGYGGAIYLTENTIADVKPGTPKITLNGGKIDSNKAEKSGGAAYLRHETEFIVTGADVQVTNNSAEEDGGAIYIAHGNANIQNGTFTGNVASKNGGALYVNGTLSMSGGTIDGGEKASNATNGGGVYVIGGNVELTNGTIANCAATNNGGGVHVSNTSVTFGSVDGRIYVTGNTAKNGAGFYLDQTGTGEHSTTISNGEISKNVASECGGGMYLTGTNGKITVTGGKIDGNQAANGGGIYLIDSAELEVVDGYIIKNRAVGMPDEGIMTAYNSVDTHGVGGGISVVGNSSATQETLINVHGDPIGVYGNTADFAADDVFASGEGTKLTLPAKADMNIEDPEFTATTGWFEDYATGDTMYKEKGLYGNTMVNNPERYRTLIANNGATVRAFVDKEEYTDSGSTVTTSDKYTNQGDIYVCITLGVINLPDGSLTIQKVFDADVADAYKSQIFVFEVSGETIEHEQISFRVQTQGVAPVTITNLPQGVYTVTEISDWSWRFECESSEVITLTDKNPAGSAEMKNTLKEDQWLDYDISKANTYETVNVTP